MSKRVKYVLTVSGEHSMDAVIDMLVDACAKLDNAGLHVDLESYEVEKSDDDPA